MSSGTVGVSELAWRKSSFAAEKIRGIFQHEDENHVEEAKERMPPQFCKCFIIIHPYSVFRRYWDVCIMMFLFYLCVSVPFMISFGQDPSHGMGIFDRIVDAIFAADIVLNFMTGITVNGKVNLQPDAIAKDYLTTFFVIDFISAIPVDEIIRYTEAGGGQNSLYRTSKFLKIFKLLRLLKLFRVLRMNRILSRLEAQLAIKYGLLKCVKFSMFVLFAAHILACLFVYIANFGPDPDHTWMTNFCQTGFEGKCLVDETIYDQYVASMYWAITTMSTIGYGDIVPQTSSERLVALVCMCIGASIFGYGITNMCTLLANLNSSDVNFRTHMDTLHEFFEYRNVPKDLRTRVREYFHYKRNSAMLFNQEPQLLDAMSVGLRREVMLTINSEFIERNQFLSNAHADTVVHVVELLSREAAGPAEVVVRQGEMTDSMFLIANGLVEVMFGTWSKEELSGTDMFGEVEMVYPMPRMATVRTITYTDLYVLTRRDFDAVVRLHEDVKGPIMKVARERLLYSVLRKIRICCHAISAVLRFGKQHIKDYQSGWGLKSRGHVPLTNETLDEQFKMEGMLTMESKIEAWNRSLVDEFETTTPKTNGHIFPSAKHVRRGMRRSNSTASGMNGLDIQAEAKLAMMRIKEKRENLGQPLPVKKWGEQSESLDLADEFSNIVLQFQQELLDIQGKLNAAMLAARSDPAKLPVLKVEYQTTLLAFAENIYTNFIGPKLWKPRRPSLSNNRYLS